MRIGDIVTIRWEYIEALLNVKIVYIPSAPDDAWEMVDKDGKEYLIQHFCLMEKKEFDKTS